MSSTNHPDTNDLDLNNLDGKTVAFQTYYPGDVLDLKGGKLFSSLDYPS
jgi:hypothetical protein